jgi:hypothetical protein
MTCYPHWSKICLGSDGRKRSHFINISVREQNNTVEDSKPCSVLMR